MQSISVMYGDRGLRFTPDGKLIYDSQDATSAVRRVDCVNCRSLRRMLREWLQFAGYS